MVDFTRQRSFNTRKPLLPVDGGMPPGIYTFQLEVTDDGGNRSKAAQVKIRIISGRGPGPTRR
jgi:hypothetical protein